jgi:hypothetical protein
MMKAFTPRATIHKYGSADRCVAIAAASSSVLASTISGLGNRRLDRGHSSDADFTQQAARKAKSRLKHGNSRAALIFRQRFPMTIGVAILPLGMLTPFS